MSEQMNSQEQEGTSQDQARFPMPRTFPKKWRLSTDNSGQRGATANGKAADISSQQLPVHSDVETDGQAAAETPMETFPQPRTFPKHWRLTGTE